MGGAMDTNIEPIVPPRNSVCQVLRVACSLMQIFPNIKWNDFLSAMRSAMPDSGSIGIEGLNSIKGLYFEPNTSQGVKT